MALGDRVPTSLGDISNLAQAFVRLASVPNYT